MDLDTYYEKCGEIVRRTADQFSARVERYEDALAKVVRREYCVGTDGMHRGAYCPSLIQDIVIGKTKRGRATDVRPRNGKYSFVYGFDGSDRLLVTHVGWDREIISYEDQAEIGISFSTWGGMRRISLISECTYEAAGRLAKYSTFQLSADGRSVDYSESEKYTYEDDKLIVDMYRYSPVVGVVQDKFIFPLVDGYLSPYTVENYKDGKRVPSVWDGHVWPVRIKRKI